MSFSDNIIKLVGEDTTNMSMIRTARDLVWKEKRVPRIMYDTPSVPVPSPEPSPFDPLATVPMDADVSWEKTSEAEVPKVRMRPEQMGWYEIDSDLYGSIILNAQGGESDNWDMEMFNRPPDEYPRGWKQAEAVYDDGRPIPAERIVAALRENVVPNNWDYVINKLRKEGPREEVGVARPTLASLPAGHVSPTFPVTPLASLPAGHVSPTFPITPLASLPAAYAASAVPGMVPSTGYAAPPSPVAYAASAVPGMVPSTGYASPVLQALSPVYAQPGPVVAPHRIYIAGLATHVSRGRTSVSFSSTGPRRTWQHRIRGY